MTLLATSILATTSSSFGLFAAGNAIQQQASDLLGLLDHPTPVDQSVNVLRDTLRPVTGDSDALQTLDLPTQSGLDLLEYVRSETAEPSASLLGDLTERADTLKGLIVFPSEEGEPVSVTADGSEAQQALLRAFDKAGLSLDRQELLDLRTALRNVLTDDVLVDFPSTVADALRSLRGDSELTAEQIQLLEMDVQDLMRAQEMHQRERGQPQVIDLSPQHQSILARHAPTIFQVRQITAAETNAQEAISRMASAERRTLTGASQYGPSAEPLTLTKILANPEQYQNEPLEIVIVDYDGTVRRRRGGLARHGQLWAEWLIMDVVCHPKQSVGVSLIKTLTLVIPGLINGVIEKIRGEGDPESTNRIIAKALEIGDAERFQQSFERFVKYYGHLGHSPEVVKRLKRHMEAGQLVLISSASPKDLVAGVLKEFGVPSENVQGTWFEIVEDADGNPVLTGKFHWNHDVRKITQLEEETFGPLRNAGINFVVSHVYTDSPSDMPLVELAERDGGSVHATNSSKRDFIDTVIQRRGTHITEQAGVFGFVFGGNEGVVTETLAKGARGDRELVERGTYREERAPYLGDWGRAVGREGLPSGVAYYTGSVVAQGAMDLLEGDPLNFLGLVGDPASVAMGTTAFMASTLLSAGLVRDGSSNFMRRVWIQRVLPLMVGVSVAGIDTPVFANHPMAGMLIGSALFALQGFGWGRDIADIAKGAVAESRKALPTEAPALPEHSEHEAPAGEAVPDPKVIDGSEDAALVATVTDISDETDINQGPSAFVRTLQNVGVGSIPLVSAALLGGTYYLVGTPSFGTALLSALLVGVGAEATATGLKGLVRQVGAAETDEKRSWWGGLFGRSLSTSAKLTAFRAMEFLSRFVT